MFALTLLKASLSPTGRCNRIGLFRITCLLVAVQLAAAATVILASTSTGGAMGPVLVVLAKCVFLWLGFCVTAKRLHDIGVSIWWIPGSFLLLIVWSIVQTTILISVLGPQILDINGPGFWVSMAGTTTPVLAATLWLHYAPGMKTANRHGPPPGSSGYSRPNDVEAKPPTPIAPTSAPTIEDLGEHHWTNRVLTHTRADRPV